MNSSILKVLTLNGDDVKIRRSKKGTAIKGILSKDLKENLTEKVKTLFQSDLVNPMLKASYSWKILAEQLETILGPEIFAQWFREIKPLVFSNNVLILQTKNTFAAQWINEHYQDLVDALIKIQDKKICCFFIAPKIMEKPFWKRQ